MTVPLKQNPVILPTTTLSTLDRSALQRDPNVDSLALDAQRKPAALRAERQIKKATVAREPASQVPTLGRDVLLALAAAWLFSRSASPRAAAPSSAAR